MRGTHLMSSKDLDRMTVTHSKMKLQYWTLNVLAELQQDTCLHLT